MKKLMMTCGGAAILLSGCMTQHMKETPFYEGIDVTYSGNAENRVNLWPLAYWREPVCSICWPILSFSDEHFALRPLYSDYGTEHNFLWPLGHAKDGDWRLFPFYWGNGKFNIVPLVCNRFDCGFHMVFPILFLWESDYLTIFPFVWWDIPAGNFTLFPFFGCNDDSHWLFPLYYHDNNMTWITPFLGNNSNGSHWILPLYINNPREFYSPLWCCSKRDEKVKNRETWWCAPPLLSWGIKDGDVLNHRYFGGFGGFTAKNGTIPRSWLIPFWYRNEDTLWITPIWGKTNDSHWLFPLWYKEADSFFSLPYCRVSYRDDCGVTIIPPLLSKYETYGRGRSSLRVLLGMYGHEAGENGVAMSDWLFPIYNWRRGERCEILLGLGGWKKDDSHWFYPIYEYDYATRDLKTLLFGRVLYEEENFTRWWWLTKFVGHTTGEKQGFHVDPIFNWEEDRHFSVFNQRINAEKLDDSVECKLKTIEHYENGKPVKKEVLLSENEGGTFNFDLCLGLWQNRHIIYQAGGDNAHYPWVDWSYYNAKRMADDKWRVGKKQTISLCKESILGDFLIYNRKSNRVVNFDYETKEKVFDGEFVESFSLFGLIWSSRKENIAEEHHYLKRSLLWRLWHYENLNGDSTMDIFPCITCDKKKNGYSKISFLWRFFRYEKDPDKGTSIDFFFIPIWRP